MITAQAQQRPEGQAAFNISDKREIGGEGGIRTHGTIAGTTVFETAPIGHSGTSPLWGEGP